MIKRRTKKTKTQKQATSQNQPSDQLTFLEHFYELRSRLFWIVVSLIVTSAIGFQYNDFLVKFVMGPLDGQKLVYLTPGGGFSFIFTICLYFGALVTIPVVMYHIYRFLQPVLGKTSRRFIVLILLLSSLLAASGAIFGYMVAVPAAIQFLATFAADVVTPSLTAESYLGFIVAYMLGLAALFQLPLLLFIFDHVRPFPPGALLTSQRFVIVGAVIAAAIITPTPDVVNQLIIAGPIILIYQLGAIAVYIRHKAVRRDKKQVTLVKEQKEDAIPTQVEHTFPEQKPATALQPAQSIRQVVPAKKSVSMPAVTAPRRSVDGFSKRPTRQSLAVPGRGAPATQPEGSRQYRSIDGIVA